MSKQEGIMISGAGYTGLLTALSLLTSGIECCIIEKQPLETLLIDDGKSFAISQMALNFFEKLGIEINKDLLPIKACYCFEEGRTELMKIENGKLLAGMISTKVFKKILFDKLNEFSNFKLYDNYTWQEIKYNPYSQTSAIFSQNKDEPDFIADLIISTEGRNSKMINYFHLSQKHYDYNQDAIIFNIIHDVPHLQQAIEKFFPEGAIAILPLKDLNNKNQSAIVWINKNIYSNYIWNLDEEEFTNLFNKKIDYILGKIQIVNFEDRKKYPLKLSFLTKYSHNNIIFLGDINHTIHPIAGQGFNLTIQDIIKVTELLGIYDFKFELEEIKKSFFRKRVTKNYIMIGFTHILVKAFENDNKILQLTRNKIIEYIEKFNLQKNFF